MPRVDASIAERSGYYDEDDREALAQLAPLAGSGEAAATGSTQFGQRQSVLEQVSPVTSLALKHLAVASILGQAKGRVPAIAHEWADQVLGFDFSQPGDWHIIGGHSPLAVAAGIAPKKIEAFRAGRLEELGEPERKHVEFVRQVVQGRVTDQSWADEVEFVGSERGVVELISIILLVFTHIRIAQALGFPGTPDADLEAQLAALKNGTHELGSIEAYQDYFQNLPWPRQPALRTQ